MASSSSRRPHSTPIPDGPSILCAENARKSAPSAATSTGRCGTDWAPSATTRAPRACARAAISPTGGTVPVTLDWCVTATSLVRSLISSSARDRSSRPSGVTPNQRSVAPVRWHSCCQGTRLAWCSISVTRISSPGPTRNRCASRPGGGRVAHRVGDQVQPLGRALGEHDLAGIRADERRDPHPGALVGVGGLLAEQVRAAVSRRVVHRVEVTLGVEHLARLVRGSAGVQVDQRPARRAPPGRGSGSRPGSRATSNGRAAAPVSPACPVGAEVAVMRRPPSGTSRSRPPPARRPARRRPPRRSGRRRTRARSRAARTAGSGCSG